MDGMRFTLEVVDWPQRQPHPELLGVNSPDTNHPDRPIQRLPEVSKIDGDDDGHTEG